MRWRKKPYTASHALSRIDVPSVLFFLGILLAVSCLQSMEILSHFAAYLDQTIGDNRVIITLIGILSAIVDNVPLVAASMGMYSLDTYHMDHMIWEYLAYCAGTGGSILIIGSAVISSSSSNSRKWRERCRRRRSLMREPRRREMAGFVF